MNLIRHSATTGFVGPAILLGGWLLGISQIAIAQGPLARFELSKPSMGSMLDLVVYATNQQQAEESINAGLAELERLSLILSNYDATSEVSVVNQSAFQNPVRVSRDLAAVLDESHRWHSLSLGRFDITVGPLSQLWRANRKSNSLPTNDQIKIAQQASGWQQLHWTLPTPQTLQTGGTLQNQLAPTENEPQSQRTLSLQSADARLDVSGLATGYIIDRMFEAMVAKGTDSILINAGGDIRVGKAPPGRKGWRLDVAGLGKESPLIATYWITQCAVTTSGDLVQFVEIDGRRFSHFIDPRTGIPIERRQSVTVFAATTLDADAGATALAVMGMELSAEQFSLLPLGKALFMQVDKEASDIRFRTLGNSQYGLP